MGTSGALSTSNQYIKYKITITQNSQSVANNTSNVTVTVNFYRTNTGYTTYGNGTVYCKINGTTYSASVTTSQKITSSGINLFTKTLNIPHATDGTKTLTCSAWIDHSQVDSSEQSYSMALTTIPRKSTMSVANGTLGASQTITVTRQASSFTHSIKAVCGSSTVYIKADGSTSTSSVTHGDCSIPFTPPVSWASQNTTGRSVTVKYTITTYNGTTSIGNNTYTRTCTIPDISGIRPTCTVSVSDSKGYATTYGGYIKGMSRIAVSITGSPKYGTTIKSYSTVVNGSTYTAKTFTTGVLKTAGTVTVSTKVTDARGISSKEATTDVTVLDYSAPYVSKLNIIRCNADGTENEAGSYVKVTFDGSISDLENKNTVTYTLQYKKTSDTDYTTVELSDYNNSYEVSGASAIFAADTGSSYNVDVTATDAFTSYTRSGTASTEQTIMHFNAAGNGMGIGKLSEHENMLDIGWLTHSNKPLCLGDKKTETVLDGQTGLYLSHEGFMHLQRSNEQGYDPYIGFIVGNETSYSGRIGINQSNGCMYLSDAARYDLSASAYIKGNIRLIQDNYSDANAVIQCLWADAGNHNLIERTNDGLTSAFGWAGSSSYATVTLIRGRTCKYQNSSGTATLSDIRLKEDFTDLSKWESFYDSIEPCAFRLKTGSKGRFHIGYKAQQVEQALLDSGLTTEDFAGFIKMPYAVDEDDPERAKTYEEAGIEPGSDEYGLIYTEFVALNTYKIQKLQKENTELHNEISDLKSRLDKLEAMLAANNE